LIGPAPPCTIIAGAMLVIESYGVLQITQTKSFPIPILSPSTGES
jgi:hypothetical protein